MNRKYGKDNPAWKGGKIKYICKVCKKETYDFPCKINRKKYCSHKCKDIDAKITEARENSPLWRGGIHHRRGYNYAKNRKHPNCDPNGYIAEHRIVMESKIGRYLLKSESVHHINEIRDDNRPENLMLFASESEHQKYHQKLKREAVK